MWLISFHVLNGATELCHFTTVPVCPAKVNKPLVLPEQIVVPPITDPPTLVGSAIMVTSSVAMQVEAPLVAVTVNKNVA